MKLKKEIKILLLVIIVLLGLFFFASFNSENKRQNSDTDKKPIEIDEKSITLTVVGDFLYEQPYYNSIENGDDINNYFSLVKQYFIEDDLSLGNMEVVIGDETMKVSGLGYNFCAPEYIGKQVATLDLEVLSTANNHSNDRGIEGRKSTIDFFKNNSDILTVGTYLDNPRDLSNNVISINGIDVGILSYTYGTNIKVPKDERYSLGLFKDPDGGGFTEEYQSLIKEEISTIDKMSDIVIVMMHWGKEFTFSPSDEQKNIAQFLNEAGVDIVVGSHSHSIEPIEWIKSDKKDTLVYYSMGNFVSADEDISRTGETFDNAYQFGLLSQLKVTLKNGNTYISNITTEPIVNYYDSNFRNFTLVPLSLYDETYEKSHYRYKQNFTKKFIEDTYISVIDEEFR